MSDADRDLSPEGRLETAAAARGLKRLRIQPSQIFTSPLRRAVSTAELVAEEIRGPISIAEQLSAGASPSRILTAIKHQTADALIVGHNPDLIDLVSFLVSPGPGLGIDLNTGGVVAIAFADAPKQGVGVLQWYLRRKQLALLAESVSVPT